MDELKKIMLSVLSQYISMSMHVAQKSIMTSRNPQQWMVDKTFQGLFQNIPQHFQNASNPAPPAFDMSSLMAMFANTAPQQGVHPPVQPPISQPIVTP